MNTIGRYIIISFKENFVYRLNAFLVILDSFIDISGIFIFWYSLTKIGFLPEGLDETGVYHFIAFTIIAFAVRALFVGTIDLADHIVEGTLDYYLVKPYNAYMLILLERINFLRITVMFTVGTIILLLHADSFLEALLGIVVSTLGTIAICLIPIILTLLSFYFKKMDGLYYLMSYLYITMNYPTTMYSRDLRKVFTFIFPIAFSATIPAQIQSVSNSLLLYIAIFLGMELLVFKLFWKIFRGHYEPTN